MGSRWSKKYEKYATWLYNDASNNIVFQVTSVYPEKFPEDSIEIAHYKKWLEIKYAPFFTCIISRDTAIKCLDQINLVLKTIKDNVAKLKNEFHDL